MVRALKQPNNMIAKDEWMRRDRDEKMKALYGFPVDLPEDEEDSLAPARGIIFSVAFCVLCGAVATIIYLATR